MHYLYVKAPVSYHSETVTSWPGWFGRLLPALFLSAGLFLLCSAIVPIAYYQLFSSPRIAKLAKPVQDDFLASQPKPETEVLGQTAVLDMSQPSNWFHSAPRFLPRPSKITHYTLSIPKLGIKNAIVQIGGEDLKKTLIQYEGTAFPGQFGNTVIFGHSALPQFFSPTNYVSIFSTLPSLKKKDVVLIDFDGVGYKYVVTNIFEVEPDDISVLEQRFDDSYLTLVTCVPPGTYLRRLIVEGHLAFQE